MISSNDDFKELLLLHGRDRRHDKVLEEQKKLPNEISRMDQKIKIEQESIDQAVTEWKELETRNNSLEKELIEISEKLARSKVRQLEVKKNEEYAALENEITSLLEKQSSTEDLQIEVLVKIDDARETAKIADQLVGGLVLTEGKIAEKVKDFEKQKASLSERDQSISLEISEIEQEISDARNKVVADMLRTYDRIKRVVTKPPYLAPLSDQKCSGCHLKVSNDVVSSVLVEQKLTQCDQCGRIVYVER